MKTARSLSRAVQVTDGALLDHDNTSHITDGATATRAMRGAERQAQSGAKAEGLSLGKNASTVDTASKAQVSRSERNHAREMLSQFTSLPRVAKCGRVSVAEGGSVLLRAAKKPDGSVNAGYGALHTCGSVWACPVCSAKITVRRAEELETIVGWNAARGGTVALATFTMSHNKGQRLADLWDGVSGAWRNLVQSRTWRKLRKDLGLDHYVRATELTHGDNGWHVHLHVLMLFDAPISAEMIEVFTDDLYLAWQHGLSKGGFTASRKHGVDVRQGKGALDGMGKYLSKVVFEAVGGRFKQGREGGRTPFQILADALSTGNMDDIELWWQFEQASKGRRQLSLSRGLKAAAGVVEVDDKDIAEEEVEGSETVAELPADTWKAIRPVSADILTMLENEGLGSVLDLFESRGLRYEITDAGARMLGEEAQQWPNAA